MKVKISRRTAEWCLSSVDPASKAAVELRRALQSSRKAATRAKRETKKEETARIRAEVFARADGPCELCDALAATDLHHAFGRTRVKQAVTNTMALCRPCHLDLTANRPSSAHWWEQVARHFRRCGFVAEARMAENNLAKALERNPQACPDCGTPGHYCAEAKP